jgi:hypothetical protein
MKGVKSTMMKAPIEGSIYMRAAIDQEIDSFHHIFKEHELSVYLFVKQKEMCEDL